MRTPKFMGRWVRPGNRDQSVSPHHTPDAVGGGGPSGDAYLLEDAVSFFLLEDGTSILLLE